MSFVRYSGFFVSFEDVLESMDDELVVKIHQAMKGVYTDQEFFDSYLVEHVKKFGSEFNEIEFHSERQLT